MRIEKGSVMEPLISIIVPVYNVENYVAECITSLINQTYRNIEILLVDDGSTDKSGQICDSFANDDRIRVFHTKNAGVSAARNYALDRARGDYIGFADSDDRAEPEMFETLLRCAEKSGADVALCGFDREYPSGIRQSSRPPVYVEASGAEAVSTVFYEYGLIYNYAWNKLFRREFFESGLRFPVGFLYEDQYVITRLLCSGGKIACMPEILYHYRQRRSSIVHEMTFKASVDYWTLRHERFKMLKKIKAAHARTVRDCVDSAFRVFYTFPQGKKVTAEAKEARNSVREFIRENYSEVMHGNYGRATKMKTLICRMNAVFIARLLYLILPSGKKLAERKAEDLYP